MMENCSKPLKSTDKATCPVCFRHCRLGEGQRGFCHGRVCKEGEVVAQNYGEISSLCLDPIEKKPLKRFHPGSKILSVGSYGCNLSCPFCQNYEISFSCNKNPPKIPTKYISPEELCYLAVSKVPVNNIGLAFTYNEPLIGYEYVRDCGKLIHKAGLLNVLVTNGTCEIEILEEILPLIDAINVDFKGFSSNFYSEFLGGNIDQTMNFIKKASEKCHVEITTLIIPGYNDSDKEMVDICKWIASLKNGENIPYHISRFFPRNKMKNVNATDVELVYHLADIAKQNLKYVYEGNC
ncbi:pyruvate formate lyase activating enzyme [Acetitomaculum ruminis DSM 5522]|uniref:Pyruvate formate lyase activating enzyme n=1 Tax=Acetitomaculum ruminis DSM 5522 TaxID=1120918 RepID=A0A1I0V1G0_9FIRM|nr:AmmeMemoRadiSam system radical SAM enzyme [Acetitomaculum ruminis]SFA69887.1 pyruvate formate lyase activating enzyme [Acetitomaculum ruminis DSM 5522]